MAENQSTWFESMTQETHVWETIILLDEPRSIFILLQRSQDRPEGYNDAHFKYTERVVDDNIWERKKLLKDKESFWRQEIENVKKRCFKVG